MRFLSFTKINFENNVVLFVFVFISIGFKSQGPMVGGIILPKITSAKLLFSTNSYTRSCCSRSPKQQPLSFTRFLCLILVTSTISLENSSIPCCTSGNNNFTAISLPSNTPYKYQTTPKNHFSTISNLSWSFINMKHDLIEKIDDVI